MSAHNIDIERTVRINVLVCPRGRRLYSAEEHARIHTRAIVLSSRRFAVFHFRNCNFRLGVQRDRVKRATFLVSGMRDADERFIARRRLLEMIRRCENRSDCIS